jgi:hypothetical protein
MPVVNDFQYTKNGKNHVQRPNGGAYTVFPPPGKHGTASPGGHAALCPGKSRFTGAKKRGTAVMIFSFAKPQTAYVSSSDYFTAEKKEIPGVTVYSQEEKAKNRSIPRKGMIAGKQWYAVEIPAPDTFLYRAKPITEQPFPVLHGLLSQKSLSLLFADELTVFRWQLSCYLKEKRPEEAEIVSNEETTAFYHEKRNTLLSLATGEALVSFVKEKAAHKTREALPAYFSALDISGIADETDGNTAFLIFNPRASIKILAIHRDTAIHFSAEE